MLLFLASDRIRKNLITNVKHEVEVGQEFHVQSKWSNVRIASREAPQADDWLFRVKLKLNLGTDRALKRQRQ